MLNLVIYGTGTAAEMFYNKIKDDSGFNLLCFVESKKSKELFMEKKVCVPNEIRQMNYDYLIVASMYVDEIYSVLRNNNINITNVLCVGGYTRSWQNKAIEKIEKEVPGFYDTYLSDKDPFVNLGMAKGHGDSIVKRGQFVDLREGIENASVAYDKFFSLYIREKYAENIVSLEKSTTAMEKTAIIMQGPLVREDDFTLETVKIYEKLFPGTVIIVSTWEDSAEEYVKKLSELSNCIVLLNEPPKFSGILNLNMQVVSTLAGIKKAKELEKEYVFKTRCDYRFYKKGIIDAMVNLLGQFQVDKSVDYQKQRFIAASPIQRGMFYAFWLTDQYIFGNIDDMYNYWNYDLDNCNINRFQVGEKLKKISATEKQRIEMRLCAETNIIMNYFKRMKGGLLEPTICEYWKIVKENFIVMSHDELGAFWNKYEYKYQQSLMNASLDLNREDESWGNNFNFFKWLSLYSGSLNYSVEDERYNEMSIY